ncbi:MAG TPA: BadF/BadG/BcrA/BcrD ATPase family protein [Propionibacteriaceae bacterium]|nr:BadF/BadG/BcrA/BcrD ATPase family protein [Propionibacteriaceae bacterium]
MTDAILALDCGQSGTRGRLTTGTGEALAPDVDLPAVRTDLPVIEQLAGFAATVIAAGHEVGTVALGVTGLTEDDRPETLLSLLAPHGVTRVALAHDSITSYLAALGADPGVVVASGTGVVTLAVGAERIARVDGWGYIMGDAGSGWWIGREGLVSGMRAFDGRGGSEGMLAAIRRDFGAPTGAYMVLQADPARVQRVASYARLVLDLAAEGDAACRDIVVRAAGELADSAATGLRLVGETDEPRAAGLGGIFRSPLMAESFAAQLAAMVPGARVVPPRGAGLDGAALLARLPGDHPLRTAFSEAEA